MRHGSYSDDLDVKLNWQVLKTIWPYLMEYKRRITVALLFLFAAKGASVVGPFLLKYIVDGLDVESGGAAALVVVPVALIVAYGLARFGNVLFGELRDTVFGRVTERAMRRIGLQVFRHLHNLDLEFHLNRRTGGLARDIERGITGISFLMRFFVFNIAPTLFEILMVMALLFYNYGIVYPLVTLISVIVYTLYSIKATQWRTRFVREVNRADSSSNTRAVDSLINFETVKYFTNEEFEANRYDRELEKWEFARRKNRLSLFTLNGGQSLIIALTMTVMMLLAANDVASEAMTIGDFVLVNAFMMQLFLPLNFLGFVYREVKGSMANIEAMLALLRQTPKIVDGIDASELQVREGHIDFHDVSFHYHVERPILSSVNFSVEPGQKVAVVGASGSGKSTLMKLLFRFYDVGGGNITIDGQDIKSVSQYSLRHAIGVVPQDTVLFNDSIFENVRYGNPAASDAQVNEAIRLAHLDQFISELPEGSDTLVGERGLKLSGGEKQRVSIARTILKRPPILIFDEATSSLDSESEQAILAAIEEVSKGYTSLVIAHRLSTIIDADKIVVLDHGEIAEQGSHLQLLEKGGLYADFWQIQQQEQS